MIGIIMLIHSTKDLAQFYRDQRKQQHLSQTEIAQEIVIRQDTISKFELKPDNVRLDTVFRLLAALDIEMHLIPKEQLSSTDKSEKSWSEQW